MGWVVTKAENDRGGHFHREPIRSQNASAPIVASSPQCTLEKVLVITEDRILGPRTDVKLSCGSTKWGKLTNVSEPIAMQKVT